MKIAKNLLYKSLLSSFPTKDAQDLADQYFSLFQKDLHESVFYTQSLYKIAMHKLKNAPMFIDEYDRLQSDPGSIKNIKVINQLKWELNELTKSLTNAQNEINHLLSWQISTIGELNKFEKEICHYKELYRFYSARIATLFTAADWRSPSYESTIFGNIFYQQDKDKSKVNYKRYGYSELNEFEDWFTRNILQIKDSNIKTLATASGMSSYALVEDYLNKYVLDSSDLVMTCPYIYFENYDQLRKSRTSNLKSFSSYDVNRIYHEILKNKPRAVFIDPITNTGNINLTDLYKLISKLDQINTTEGIHLIVDATVIADGFDGFRYKKSSNKNFHLIIIESGNKYRQLGLDLTSIGFITGVSDDINIIERSRRNTGQIPYDYTIHVFPRYSKKMSLYRIKKITRNACIISRILSNSKNLKEVFNINYPLLDSNVYSKIAKKYKLCGGLISMTFNSKFNSSKKNYDLYIEMLLKSCKVNKVPINHGISFGFEITRISASASMAETTDTFLRLAVGPEYIHRILLLCKEIENACFIYSGFNKPEAYNKQTYNYQQTFL